MVDELRDLVKAPSPHPGRDRFCARPRVDLYGDERELVEVDLDTLARRGPTASPRARRNCFCSRSSVRRPSRSCAQSRAVERRRVAGRLGLDQERAAAFAKWCGSSRETGIGEITIEENGMP